MIYNNYELGYNLKYGHIRNFEHDHRFFSELKSLFEFAPAQDLKRSLEDFFLAI